MLPQTQNKQTGGCADDPASDSKRVLEPLERISEVLFGLIVVLTFTSTIRPRQTDQIQGILLQALGCTLAWAIIDAGFYLVACLSDRGRKLMLLRQLREADRDQAQQIIAEALPPIIAAHLNVDSFDSLQQELRHMPEPSSRPKLNKQDWKRGLAILLFASSAILPVSLPFMFMTDAKVALLVSHLIAIALLFVAGWALGRHTSEHPMRVGSAMVAFGSVMIAVALLLGG